MSSNLFKKNQSLKGGHWALDTPSILEIIWVKKVRAIVVCGFLMKSLKKHIVRPFSGEKELHSWCEKKIK